MIVLLQAAQTILALNLNMRAQLEQEGRHILSQWVSLVWRRNKDTKPSPAQTIQAQRLPENAALQTSGETSLVKNFNR